MVDENLVRLSDFLYRDRGEALDALLIKYTHSWIVSVEFGGIRRLWRRSRDRCYLSDGCMVSLSLFGYGK